uniref:Uncharacterized protein n=1 Tax=Arundo donax TaxID=35708 RepID=A0A0A9ECU7_ARUDO
MPCCINGLVSKWSSDAMSRAADSQQKRHHNVRSTEPRRINKLGGELLSYSVGTTTFHNRM